MRKEKWFFRNYFHYRFLAKFDESTMEFCIESMRKIFFLNSIMRFLTFCEFGIRRFPLRWGLSASVCPFAIFEKRNRRFERGMAVSSADYRILFRILMWIGNETRLADCGGMWRNMAESGDRERGRRGRKQSDALFISLSSASFFSQILKYRRFHSRFSRRVRFTVKEIDGNHEKIR